MEKIFDFVVVGSGIVGLSVARALRLKGHKSICILEKEKELGVHASGRNSGVLHAGIYYSTDSLKARFCSVGSKKMQEYAIEKGIPLLKTGKVIIGTKPEDIQQIEVLYQRALANGVRVEKLDQKQLREMEPEVNLVCETALFSPDTAVIDSKRVLATLEADLVSDGVTILKSEELCVLQSRQKKLKTKNNLAIHYGYLVNAAGSYADRVAHLMDVGKNYRILPFKGCYRKLTKPSAERFCRAIYPVPDLRFPFLGVHITRMTNGEVIVGPTAMPAFGRENYRSFNGINFMELPAIFGKLFSMAMRNTDGIRALIFEELKKYRFSGFLSCARALVPSLCAEDFSSEGKVGLRAQLVDGRTNQLVMDFLVEKGPDSIHILNAVSPGFTASFAFSNYVVDQIN